MKQIKEETLNALISILEKTALNNSALASVLAELKTSKLPYETPTNKMEIGINAFKELLEIVAGYNKNKPVLDFNNAKQTKYYLYKYRNNQGAWSVSVDSYCGTLRCPAGIHFHSETEARECYDKHSVLWEQYWESVA